MLAVNHFLKRSAPDAHVHECVRVDPERFHARYCATARTYHYRVRVSRQPPDVFERGRVWHVARGHPEVSALMPDEVLNVTAMRAAAERLTGKAIDFSAFRASGCQAKSPIRELTALVVEGADPHAAVRVPDPPGVRTIAPETAADHLDDVRVEETETAAKPTNTANASVRWSRTRPRRPRRPRPRRTALGFDRTVRAVPGRRPRISAAAICAWWRTRPRFCTIRCD